jgi:hypothetical protein
MENNSQELPLRIEDFFLERPEYAFCPLLPFPELAFHFPRDPEETHYQHEFSVNYLFSSAPLLLPCDLGLRVDEVFINPDKWPKKEKVDPRDEFLLTEVPPPHPVEEESIRQGTVP